MPEIITGGDVYAGLEVAVLATAGEAPTYPTRWRRVPLAGDSMRFERVAITDSPEFNPAGSAPGDKFGYGIFRGTFTTRVYYNADWFAWLLSAACGGLETIALDEMTNGTVAPGTVTNTHCFFLQSFRNTVAGSIGAVPVGIALRLHKGPAGNNIEEINPAHIVGVTLRQAPRGWLTAEWEVIGVKPNLITSPGILAPLTGDYAIRPGDLSRDPTHPVLPSLCAIVAGAVVLNIDSWELTLRNNINRAAPPTSMISQVMGAGHLGRTLISGSVTTRMNTDVHEAGQPQPFLLGTPGSLGNFGVVAGIRLRYISLGNGQPETSDVKNVDNANNVPYAFDLWWQEPMAGPADTSLRDRGENTVTWNIVSTGPSLAGAGTALPNSYAKATGCVFQMQVNRADEPAVDTKFDSWSGNDPHASLIT